MKDKKESGNRIAIKLTALILVNIVLLVNLVYPKFSVSRAAPINNPFCDNIEPVAINLNSIVIPYEIKCFGDCQRTVSGEPLFSYYGRDANVWGAYPYGLEGTFEAGGNVILQRANQFKMANYDGSGLHWLMTDQAEPYGNAVGFSNRGETLFGGSLIVNGDLYARTPNDWYQSIRLILEDDLIVDGAPYPLASKDQVDVYKAMIENMKQRGYSVSEFDIYKIIRQRKESAGYVNRQINLFGNNVRLSLDSQPTGDCVVPYNDRSVADQPEAYHSCGCNPNCSSVGVFSGAECEFSQGVEGLIFNDGILKVYYPRLLGWQGKPCAGGDAPTHMGVLISQSGTFGFFEHNTDDKFVSYGLIKAGGSEGYSLSLETPPSIRVGLSYTDYIMSTPFYLKNRYDENFLGYPWEGFHLKEECKSYHNSQFCQLDYDSPDSFSSPKVPKRIVCPLGSESPYIECYEEDLQEDSEEKCECVPIEDEEESEP